MNKEYKIKLDLNKKLYNKKMAFNQFDENVNDFYIEVTKNNEVVKDLDKSIITLVAIKPNGEVDAQFIEIKEGQIYANLKPSMCDLVGNYQAKAMIVLEGEIVTTDTINYSVNEDKIISRLNDDIVSDERFTLFTDALARLSTIEISEEQRVINEAERILSEENRKIEEANRVEAELIRQHEEADRTKYDATRESNENIRKQNESIRLANETNRIDEESKRVEEENKRKLAEEERNANYNFMTEDEERRRSEANAHKEAEVLRVQAETNRVNEEAKRRTTEQGRVSAENTRVSNENTREANEVVRKNNETKRVEAETQRQSRYNSFITDAEANANNFENYTNTAKVKEEERISNELDRKSQEDRRISNENERIANEETRKANEEIRESNEISRQDIFEDKVDEFNEKIVELNTTKDNFISNINTKVDTKISEIEVAKSDMTTTVSNKVNEVEARFNALTTSQQQEAEVIDARVDFKGVAFDSLKERIDYTDKLLRDSTVSTVTTESDFTTVEATTNGYFEDVKLEGKTLVNLIDYTKLPANNNKETWNKTTNGLEITFTHSRDAVWKGSIELKANTTYTIMYDLETILNEDSDTNKTEISRVGFLVYNKSQSGNWYDKNYVSDIINIDANSLGIKITKQVKMKFTTQEESYFTLVATMYNSGVCGVTKFNNLLLLEGDHTQNPPSYFEGLKSVGEDADEIVVSSVASKRNLIDLKTVNHDWGGGKFETNISSNNLSFHSCEAFDVSFLRNKQIYGGLFRDGVLYTSIINYACIFDENKKQIGGRFGITNNGYVVPSNAKYMRLMCYSGDSNTLEYINRDKYCISLVPFKTKEQHTPHQSDKKRLLYYNNETQTWEKPILREWDSIEKHADGKYYYHQRSGEVVLNGSENWGMDSTKENTIVFRLNLPVSKGTGSICDKFSSNSTGDVEKISINGAGGLYIAIKKSKLSTQDVQGFKQWLQANNVTVVYQLAEEKVYECTNIDLITYANETNYVVESGAIVPRTTLKVHNNISNVVSLLQKKVSLLESNVKASQEVQDMMILETDMRMLDIELALMEFAPMKLNLGGSNMLRSATYFNFLKNHIVNETYEKEYLENVMNKYLATGRINQDEYNELYKMLYPPVYDIELPIEY